MKRFTAIILSLGLIGCRSGFVFGSEELSSLEAAEAVDLSDDELAFNSAAWQYNSGSDVYYQTGVVYCTDPYDTSYESFGIYVPGSYMNMTANQDGTYTFTGFTNTAVGGYTAETAPIVIPVNTAGYAAQAAPTGFSSGVTTYTDEGIIYLYAGCRGRDTTNGGAPWGVSDLKAAIRYYRYNEDVLPGNTDCIFTFGHSGGGAQSSLVGASGDSELYYPYLYSIGAAGVEYDASSGTYSSTISDATFGAMCWCPITALDYADCAYEWLMGQYSSSGTRAEGTWTKLLSDDLSEKFAEYINSITLEDEDGNILSLTDEDEDGIYITGSYYDYVLGQIEYSLNDFIDSYTDSSGSFSYSSSGGSEGGPGGSSDSGPGSGSEGGPGGSGGAPGSGMTAFSVDMASVSDEALLEYLLSIDENFDTDDAWITYDADEDWFSVRSVEDFILYGSKSASKDVGAFDDLNKSQAENYVFGSGSNEAAHFDSVMAELIASNYSEYAEADSSVSASEVSAYASSYQSDYDSYTSDALLGYGSQYRQNMYNPMYYLCQDYEGFGSSDPADHWRIKTGIIQSDTSLTVEMNLYLAILEDIADGVIDDVDFSMFWEQGHTTAERAGADSDECFIEWVNDCMDVSSSDSGSSGSDSSTEATTAESTETTTDSVSETTTDPASEGTTGTAPDEGGSAPDSGTVGDIDGSNEITANDVSCLLAYVIDGEANSEWNVESETADVNDDGSIDASDAAEILLKVLDCTYEFAQKGYSDIPSGGGSSGGGSFEDQSETTTEGTQGDNPGGTPPDGEGGGSDSDTEVDQGSSAYTITEDGTYSGATYTSTGDDENALRIDGATVTLENITVDKISGSSSDSEAGDFYGINAALLATNGAVVTIKNADVSSSAQNGNGIFSYGEGTTVYIYDTTITTAADNSGGIQTTGGGTTYAYDLTVETSGSSSAAIRSDRGGGTVVVEGGTYTTNGYNSPGVYSTADITVTDAEITANNSEALVIEGENSITLTNCTVYGNMSDTQGSSSSENVHNIMIYQSESGDAEVGTSYFTAKDSTVTSNNGDVIYATNTHCIIYLENVTFINSETEGYFLVVSGNGFPWGTEGENGAQAEVTAVGQTIDGDISVDTISTLSLDLTEGSVLTGAINIVENAQKGTAVSDNAVITIDSSSVWNLTGNCVISSLENNGTINFNGYTITLADGTVLSE
ncbi:MAG: dockerin type I domain-containing protein [Clostridiales bacterium]|nr:dockerin type I domain-containing protein [Clostridiales bacterium]